MAGADSLTTAGVVREAKALMLAKRNADAVKLLQRHVARFPADQTADYLLGNAAYRVGDNKLARAAFGRCVRANPGNAGAHYGLGLISLRRYEYESARSAFVAALDADPQLERAREQLAKLPTGPHSETNSESPVPVRNAPFGHGDRPPTSLHPSRARSTTSPPTPTAPALASDDEQPPPYATTLKGRVVVGRAQDIQLRNEQKNRPLRAYSQKLETQNVLVLTFRLRGRDGRLVTVELRGLNFSGSHPRAEERIAVPERFANGALRVRHFQNLETGEIVEAEDASTLAKGLYGARIIAIVMAVVLVLTFIALVASQVLPGFFENL